MNKLKAAGIGIFLFALMVALVTSAIDCHYLLAGISPEEVFHSEMQKLINFKKSNINGKIAYDYSHGNTNQSFQLIFREGILVDGFFFSLNKFPPSKEFIKVAKPMFAAVGFDPNNTNALKIFTNQINKKLKQNDKIKAGNYMITAQTGPCKDGAFYNLKFDKI